MNALVLESAVQLHQQGELTYATMLAMGEKLTNEMLEAARTQKEATRKYCVFSLVRGDSWPPKKCLDVIKHAFYDAESLDEAYAMMKKDKRTIEDIIDCFNSAVPLLRLMGEEPEHDGEVSEWELHWLVEKIIEKDEWQRVLDCFFRKQRGVQLVVADVEDPQWIDTLREEEFD